MISFKLFHSFNIFNWFFSDKKILVSPKIRFLIQSILILLFVIIFDVKINSSRIELFDTILNNSVFAIFSTFCLLILIMLVILLMV